MEIERKTVSSGAAYVSYPYFKESGYETFNSFYEYLAEAAKAAAAELPAGMLYHADFRASQSGEKLAVIYIIRARKYGRTVKSKQFTHIWKDGVIVSESVSETDERK